MSAIKDIYPAILIIFYSLFSTKRASFRHLNTRQSLLTVFVAGADEVDTATAVLCKDQPLGIHHRSCSYGLLRAFAVDCEGQIICIHFDSSFPKITSSGSRSYIPEPACRMHTFLLLHRIHGDMLVYRSNPVSSAARGTSPLQSHARTAGL